MAYSGFKEYMAAKRKKLDQQGTERAEKRLKSGFSENHVLLNTVDPIFTNLIFYFDGYLGSSAISLNEFKEIVRLRGASVVDHPSGSTSHIIATQLTNSKMRDWKKPVVKPDWILDSVNAGKLLPWQPYRLVRSELQPSVFQFVKKFERASPEKRPESAPSSTSSSPLLVEENPNHLVEENPNQDHFGPRPDLDTRSEWIKNNVATAPQFLDRYFENSRLHHLSTWKAELRDYVVDKLAKKPPSSTSQKHHQPVIMHVDMDCFFASISIRDRDPKLKTQPVAVAHSAGTSGKSTSEIASCNYAARDFGIKNGMSIGRARTLCKDLIVVPYEFEKYDQASHILYDIMIEAADNVQAVSCDEAFIDITSSVVSDVGSTDLNDHMVRAKVMSIAEDIRNKVFSSIGCHASIGVSYNILLSRLATKKAKPNGAFCIHEEMKGKYLSEYCVRDLPGVGWSTSSKLEEMGITTCSALQRLSLSQLQRDFGSKTGQVLYERCRGLDNRPLENKERQSIGAEVNWGVRFETDEQVSTFLKELCGEVWKRAEQSKCRGKQVTFKAKKKKTDMEPYKVLGCGDCSTSLFGLSS